MWTTYSERANQRHAHIHRNIHLYHDESGVIHQIHVMQLSPRLYIWKGKKQNKKMQTYTFSQSL